MLSHGEIVTSHEGTFVRLCLIISKGYYLYQPSPLDNISTEILSAGLTCVNCSPLMGTSHQDNNRLDYCFTYYVIHYFSGVCKILIKINLNSMSR